MATAFVNPQQPRIDAWIQPGCRADIAVVSTESWPVDTVVTIGVADAAGVIAVPLLTITPDLATVTATVALTGVQVAALAVACPPPYGVIDWQWRTGAGSPLGVGSLHWDLTGARTTQTVTVQLGPAGPIGNLMLTQIESGLYTMTAGTLTQIETGLYSMTGA